MRKLAPAKAALAIMIVTLAACSSSGGGGSDVAYKTESHFLAADPTVIEVVLRDPLPVSRAVLVDPNGVETPAYDIQRERQTYRDNGGLGPSVGVGVGGGSGGNVSSGIGIGFPIFSSGSSGTTRTVIDSRAMVKIPDPALYRSTWEQWKLKVELDDGVNKRTVEMVPPKPL